MKLLRIVVGLAFWCGVAGVVWSALARPGNTATAAARPPLAELWHYYTTDHVLELHLQAGADRQVGDPEPVPGDALVARLRHPSGHEQQSNNIARVRHIDIDSAPAGKGGTPPMARPLP